MVITVNYIKHTKNDSHYYFEYFHYTAVMLTRTRCYCYCIEDHIKNELELLRENHTDDFNFNEGNFTIIYLDIILKESILSITSIRYDIL